MSLEKKDVETIKKIAIEVEKNSGLFGAPIAFLGLLVLHDVSIMMLGVFGVAWQFYFKPQLAEIKKKKEEQEIKKRQEEEIKQENKFNPPV